jgi:hypothetical protein
MYSCDWTHFLQNRPLISEQRQQTSFFRLLAERQTEIKCIGKPFKSQIKKGVKFDFHFWPLRSSRKTLSDKWLRYSPSRLTVWPDSFRKSDQNVPKITQYSFASNSVTRIVTKMYQKVLSCVQQCDQIRLEKRPKCTQNHPVMAPYLYRNSFT